MIETEPNGTKDVSSSTVSLSDWLQAGPYTLAMSSGFFGFYAHAGVLKALEEADLLPAEVRGSSAGALVTGLWAAGVSARDIAAYLSELRRQDFWDPRPGLGFLSGRLFDESLRALLPTNDFTACLRPFRASVFDVWARRTVVRSEGDLAATIRASCSVPLMFHPVWMDGRPFLDGGILDRHGLSGHRGGRLLYHHLLPNSPWRKKTGRSSQIPALPGLRAHVVEGLPKVHPFQLERGPKAFAIARDETLRALDGGSKKDAD